MTKTPTRAELEDMEPSEIKELAGQLGITLPPRTRSTTYIEHILGQARPPAPVAEVEDAEIEESLNSTNGHIDANDIAMQVADILWDRLRRAIESPA